MNPYRDPPPPPEPEGFMLGVGMLLVFPLALAADVLALVFSKRWRAISRHTPHRCPECGR